MVLFDILNGVVDILGKAVDRHKDKVYEVKHNAARKRGETFEKKSPSTQRKRRSAIASYSTSDTSGKTSLQEAKSYAPNDMGCYKIYSNGLKYVGKAEDGIRKRFVQYYNGTTAHYPSAKKIYEQRDEINVEWKVLGSREECRATEREWIDRYHPEWNKQSGWEHD